MVINMSSISLPWYGKFISPGIGNEEPFYWNWIINYCSKYVAAAIRRTGFIAQEVEKVFPQLVNTNEKGVKTVSYTNMIPVLLQAVKEQQQQIDELKKTVEALIKK